MSFFEYSGGHFVGEHNGRKIIDTRTPMLALIPSATLTLSNYSITFPDLWSGTMYHQVRIPGPTDYFGCATWVALVEQEWGPSEPAPNTLADITLGSVPAGTDYLEIWVNLTRVVNPASILDLTLASMFPQGQWVKLDGYSCVIEETLGVARQFEFVLDGTTVKLRRFQSVNASGGVMPGAYGTRSNPGGSSNSAAFFYPGTNAPVDPSKQATYGQKIQQLGLHGGDTHRPAGKEMGSANNTPCSMSHAGISYASTWKGDIKITPGRISA